MSAPRSAPGVPRRGRGPRQVALPRPAAVRAAPHDGRPLVIDGRRVEAVRESWLIEDRWWTDRPLRRRYWELVTVCGRDLVVFHDLDSGRWYGQLG
jgi:hypothetical protein